MNSPTSQRADVIVGPTLLTKIQEFTAQDVLQNPALHPFAASSEDATTTLHEIIQATDQLAHSLSSYSSLPLSNPKLVSIMRQQAAISHALHLVSPDRSTKLLN